MSKRRRSGISLTGLIVLIGILFFTPAGGWLWNRVRELGSGCYSMLQEVGTNMGAPVCGGVSRGIAALENGYTNLRDRLHYGLGGSVPMGDMGGFAQNLFDRIAPGNSTLAGLTSTGDKLRAMMNDNPHLSSVAAGANDRLRTALDQFVIGQHYLQGSSAGKALPWFRESADQPGGYGVLSQLTLGDIYRSGSYGVGQDNTTSRHYYEQALQSVQQLQQSNTPQARQLLSSLPAQPDQLRAQLIEQIRRMR